MAESTNSCGTPCCSCTAGAEVRGARDSVARAVLTGAAPVDGAVLAEAAPPDGVAPTEAAPDGAVPTEAAPPDGAAPTEAAPDGAVPTEAAPPDGAALLRELDRMRTLLAGRAASKEGIALHSGERLLVVARFAPGLSLETWHKLVSNGASSSLPQAESGNGAADPAAWFAFDLDPARHPQLLSLSREGAHLFGLVCPLTGALLPQAFQRELGTELTHVRTGGGELTLVLLEVMGPAPASRSVREGREGREGNAAPLTAGGPFPSSVLDDPMCQLSRMVRGHVRSCDIPGRLAIDRLAVLMPGVGPFRARALTERLMAAFREESAASFSGEDALQVRAGIACCDGTLPLSGDALLRQAGNALALAQPGFTRTFRKAGSPAPERKTQVHACEKAFLFFGDTELS